MSIKGGKASLGTRASREFLAAEALHDPLAMAMIIYQKKLINAMTGLGPKGTVAPKPRRARLRKTLLDVPFGDREEAKA